MLRRTFLGIVIALLGPALAVAQEPSETTLPRVALETAAGRIVIEVNDRAAPVTGANFLRYVDERRLDGAAFYRAMKTGSDAGLVQGGADNDPARVLAPIAHEPTTKTGLSHVDGAISMARFTPGTRAYAR